MKNFVSSYFSNKKDEIVTHSGQFHTDELMAISLLARFHLKKDVTELKIVRTRDPEILATANQSKKVFILDVGRLHNPEMLCFDHHQSDPELVWKDEENINKENLPKKSACGLIFDWLSSTGQLLNSKSQPLSEHEVMLLKKLVKKVDACDNGEATWNDALLFSNYNHGADPEVSNRQFEKALFVAQGYLDNFLHQAEREQYETKVVTDAIAKAEEDGHPEIIVFYEKIEAARFLIPPRSDKALFVATLYEGNEWSIKTVCSDVTNPYSRRMDMPAEWAGLEDEELDNASGFKNMKFCHKGRFVLAMYGNESDMLNVSKKMIKISKKN